MSKTFKQKSESAYYCWIPGYGSEVEHYVMFRGIRTRHATEDEALRICEKTNDRYGLPHVNVYKSSTFTEGKLHV